MFFSCDLANAELLADLFIQWTGGDQGPDLPFAARKICLTVPELL
jgi:hypothetical protein